MDIYLLPLSTSGGWVKGYEGWFLNSISVLLPLQRIMQTQQAGREIWCNYVVHQRYTSELSAELCVHVAHGTTPVTPGVMCKFLGEANQNINR